MKNIKLIFSVIIIIVIVVGAYLAFNANGFSITGASTAGKECVPSDAKTFFNACVSWKDSKYSDKPSALRVLEDSSARQLCDRLLEKYKAC